VLPRWHRLNLGQRATAVAITLAIEVLLLLALLSLSLSVEEMPKPKLTEVDLTAENVAEPASEEPAPEQSPQQPTEQSTPPPVDAPVLAPTLPPAAVIPLPTAPVAPPPPAEPPRSAPRAVVRDQAYGPPDTGRPASTDSVRVGTAPDGSPLYRAEWYRQPGKEFDGFLTQASPGWGLMACRTIPNFYVTDCVPLGETPGSMLTRSMLAGSGVLRVRPPRLGGRLLVGSWVRIRIDYTIRRE
jgi:periplasmic protein TonB